MTLSIEGIKIFRTFVGSLFLILLAEMLFFVVWLAYKGLTVALVGVPDEGIGISGHVMFIIFMVFMSVAGIVTLKYLERETAKERGPYA